MAISYARQPDTVLRWERVLSTSLPARARREWDWSHWRILLSGVTTGMVVASATFCVFDLRNILRVNLFLSELAGRADWQSIIARFGASGFSSLRAFVTFDYI